MPHVVNFLNRLVWSQWLIMLCLGTGLWFTVRTRFMQLRHAGEMIRLLFHSEPSETGVTSFQALALSISGRVGTGNIAGVATAIALGGPGAVFWMWTIAFLGAGSAFIEATLAQIYKVEQDGEYRGGPAFYIEKGMGTRWYAVLFAASTIAAMGIFLPGIQSNSIAVGLKNAFGLSPAATGLTLVIVLAAIIFGGVKRIAKVAELVVPFMAIAYIFVSIIIILLNIQDLPAVLSLIVNSAFAAEPIYSGILGLAISWGVKRGIYSNEAGQGTGPHAAAAAEVSHPVKQGLLQSLSVYIDTLFVCTSTAFMILITGMYNVENPIGGFISNNIGNVTAGPAYTQMAVESVFTGYGAAFVGIALLFFAFTTLMAYYYIAETNVAYLCSRSGSYWMMTALKVIMLGTTFYGAVKATGLVWMIGDVGVGLMAWVNMIAIIILQKPALLALDDYDAQRAKGLDPVFTPSALGIKNADWWEKRRSSHVLEKKSV